MKVLITGSTGLLGKSLIEKCANDIEILATYVGTYQMEENKRVRYFNLDIRDKGGYRNLFEKSRPDVTVHLAGIGSPDFAENNRELVKDINLNGTKNIIQLCEEFNSKFIFVSSNGIYDGDKAPYSEEDNAEPINYYGEIKLKGEEVTRKANVPFSIVRPILMYGWQYPFERSNIVTHSIVKLINNESVHVYNDVYVMPLLNHSCAKAIWKVIIEDKYGVYNIAGADRVSIYELIIKVAEIFKLDKTLVFPVQQGFFNELTKRPRDTSFKTDKMEKELGIRPLPLEEGLLFMKRENNSIVNRT